MPTACEPSASVTAMWVPSGLTAGPLILPLLRTRRSPYGLMIWLSETTRPCWTVWPTWSVPNPMVEPTAIPVPVTARAATADRP